MRRANEILKAVWCISRRSSTSPARGRGSDQPPPDDFEVEPVCRELDLSVSAQNARRERPNSARRQCDEHLIEHIRRIHATSGETYPLPAGNEGPAAIRSTTPVAHRIAGMGWSRSVVLNRHVPHVVETLRPVAVGQRQSEERLWH